jgi:hypothetical protein
VPKIENPYAQATVESELNSGESNQTDSTASYRRIPLDDRLEEFQWLAQNSGRYQGEWIALFGKRLLSHTTDYGEVSREVKSLGIDGAMFMFIDGAETEDFVRFLP